MALRLLPPAVRAAAIAAGVTRLADLTGLDSLGVPVWQAVRPWSRTVSVHQGKSLDPAIARLAAAMEAIEVDAAEHIAPAAVRARWCDLDPLRRTPAPDDFARERGGVTAVDELDWVLAERFGGGPPVHIPRDAVLLDFSIGDGPGRVENNSNGQGAHFSLEGAMLKGVLELIERDAMAHAFLADPHFWRFGRIEVQPGSWPWFDAIMARAGAARISLWLYQFTALAGAHVICCEMREPSAFPAPRALARGVAAALSIEAALLGAVTEAAQVRLTNIAFAREDLTARIAGKRLDAMPPFAMVGPPAAVVATPAASDMSPADALQTIVAGLREAGYADILFYRLATGHPQVHAVRVLVPGLGSGGRARRRP